jgi:hypothetical protein
MEDRIVVYHSDEWERMVTPYYAGSNLGWYAWCTWSVDNGIALMKFSRL